MKIDLNCDVGESFGRYTLGDDKSLLSMVTSANIACGFHAGDPGVMAQTVRLAVRLGVSVGAHPGYPDLQGFGRREMALSPEEVEAMVLYQVSALAGFARDAGVEVVHVKPHDALYNQAARDRPLAEAIARGVKRFSSQVILVGLAGSELVAVGKESGLRVASEGFPERGYNADGTLMSRRLPGAVLDSPAESATNAVRLAKSGVVQTLCIHGDNPAAVEIAEAICAALAVGEMEIGAMGKFL